MPIHDLGYRAWQGPLTAAWSRFWPITETGIRLAWKAWALRRLLLVAWVPAFYLAAMFLLYEQGRYQLAQQGAGLPKASSQDGLPQSEPAFDGIHQPPERPATLQQPGRGPGYRPGGPGSRTYQQPPYGVEPYGQPGGEPGQYRALTHMLPVPQTLIERIGDRHYVWSWLLWAFFRYPQGLVMVLVIGLVAPPLIAQDVRTRAFLLYFSRPLTRLEYLLGKMAAVWTYLALITLVPAVVLYCIAVLMSNEWVVVADTWDLPLRVAGASLVLIVPTTLLALAFSSMTSDTRYASFAWFAFWAIGWVAYSMVTANLGDQTSKYWTLISLYHTLGEVQRWVFGLEEEAGGLGAGLAALELIVLAVVSWLVLFRRVSAPMRV